MKSNLPQKRLYISHSHHAKLKQLAKQVKPKTTIRGYLEMLVDGLPMPRRTSKAGM